MCHYVNLNTFFFLFFIIELKEPFYFLIVWLNNKKNLEKQVYFMLYRLFGSNVIVNLAVTSIFDVEGLR